MMFVIRTLQELVRAEKILLGVLLRRPLEGVRLRRSRPFVDLVCAEWYGAVPAEVASACRQFHDGKRALCTDDGDYLGRVQSGARTPPRGALLSPLLVCMLFAAVLTADLQRSTADSDVLACPMRFD